MTSIFIDEHGVRAIANRYRSFFESYATKAQMVAGNLEQVTALVGLEPTASLQEVSPKLTETQINAIVTLDAKGAFAKFADEEVLVPTKEVEVVDSTGAGDAFLAAFIIAKKRGVSLKKALAVSNMISGKVIQYKSARLPLSIGVPQLIQEAMQIAEGIDDR